jgi:cytochrome c-type protein NapB
MNKQISVFLFFIIGLALTALPLQAEDVQSLRGNLELEAPSEPPTVNRVITDDRPMTRDFVNQPPLIPHKIEGYQLDKNFNKCLSCHSWANYQKARATKIPPTHFKDRDGNERANLSANRYFCTQCHVPQKDVVPLIENVFEPVKALR